MYSSDSASRHIRDGQKVQRPYKLTISALDGESGRYLIHWSRDGAELADTYHDRIQDALEQAKFEFGVTESEWSKAEPE